MPLDIKAIVVTIKDFYYGSNAFPVCRLVRYDGQLFWEVIGRLNKDYNYNNIPFNSDKNILFYKSISDGILKGLYGKTSYGYSLLYADRKMGSKIHCGGNFYQGSIYNFEEKHLTIGGWIEFCGEKYVW